MALSSSAVFLPSLLSGKPTVLEKSCLQDGINEACKTSNATQPVPIATSNTLTAFAQLGAFRLGCSWSGVILFDGDRANVIAEATPSLLLNGKGLDDELLRHVGTLSHQIRPAADDTASKRYALVQDHESLRFFAAVPLYDPIKTVNGAYCIVDTKSHSEFGNDEVASMRELAELIGSHINGFKTGRSEQLIDGLTTFVSGQAVGRSEKDFCPNRHLSYLPDSLSISDNHLKGSAPSTPGVTPRESGPGSPSGQSRRYGRRNSVAVTEGSIVSDSMSVLFSRASALLRKCMDLDGVVFLDATRSNSRISRSASVSDLEDRDEGSNLNSPSSVGPWRERDCEPLAYDVNSSFTTVSEGLLHDLFRVFPKGAIFNSDLNCSSQDCRHHPLHAVTLRLAHELPDAKSLLFLPLWNWNTSRWLAGALLWRQDDQQRFHDQDLLYARAFGSSIISEAVQTDWQATEQSKSDLLSSVSHELRSPLHGMLASTELLHSTDLQPSQKDMLTMVETCGLTLLDTLNYLLDFTKINNLTSADGANLAQLNCEFDLDTLIEDVVDTLYAGHRSHVAGRYLTSGRTRSDSEPNLSVIVRIEQGNWRVQSVPGGWRRVVMNLLGNAFKFTESGFIEVTVCKVRTGANRVLAHLTITDTGCGISREYLEHSLFTPFTQESLLTEGVGLGMSIVHRLVTQAGGQIDVKSTVGKGTQVDVRIPVEVTAQDVSAGHRPGRRVDLIGLNVYPDACRLSVEEKRKLSVRSALSDAILSRPGWTVSFADSLEEAGGDIGVVEGSLSEMTKSIALKTLIVLGQGSPAELKDVEVIYISQPLTPRKITTALDSLGSEIPGEHGPAKAEPPAKAELNVLIVDDNDINLKILSTFLRRIGCSYETATNGLVALEKYQTSPRFDYILMDISMPVMDGIRSTSKIREYEEEHCLPRTVIMAVSGVASATMQQQAFAAGMDDYLVKPLSLDDLKRIMNIQ